MRLTRAVVLFMLLAFGFTLVIAQENQPNVTIHVVQRGETLFRIALNYGLSVDELARINSIVNPSNIMVGQRLLIPLATSEDGEATSVPMLETPPLVPSETPVVNQGILPTSVPYSAVAAQISGDQPRTNIYTIQRGETLFSIATRYGLSVHELARANDIFDPTVIYAGQQLILPSIDSTQPTPIALNLPEPITSLEARPGLLVEGQTFRIHVTTSKAATLTGTFLSRPFSAGNENEGTSHTILQGIPIFTTSGAYPLEINVNDGSTQTLYTLNLEVLAGSYGSEYIRLMAGRDGLLDPSLEQAEQSLVSGVMSQFTPERYFNGLMSLPAAATIISPFGTRRSYNGGAFDRFHSGTDFAGAPGTPVLASAPGRIVLADTLNVRGMATIINHGWGVYTGYWHQSQQYVQVGDTVTTGQVIGAIGSTGRVTGAHLHWELWVGGVAVDPMQWVRFSFL
jgi:murein DD-endopeptidase MepM/ murein hydrolase activator NlpD